MVVGISSSPPIISLRGGFVYFPNSTEATRVEPRRKGAAGLIGRRNRHILFHTDWAFILGTWLRDCQRKNQRVWVFEALFFRLLLQPLTATIASSDIIAANPNPLR